MTITEINNLTLDDKFFDILYRLVDFSIITNNKPQYDLNPDSTMSMFSRLKLNSQITSPTLAEMDAELIVLKAELEAVEVARVAEVKRRSDIQVRLDALYEYHVIASNIGKHVPNGAVEFLRIIEENDVALLAELEVESAKVKGAIAAEKAAKPMKDLRIKRDQMLKETDFSQIADAPLTTAQKAIYQQYRTYLRSLPGDIASGAVLMQPVQTFAEFIASNNITF